MNFKILFLIITQALVWTAFAENVDPHVTQLVSVVPLTAKNVRGDARYRAFVKELSEGGIHVFVDKVELSNEDLNKVIWERELRYHDDAPIEKHFEKLSAEEQIFCCQISELKWQTREVSFKVKVKEKSFSCSVQNGLDQESPLKCKP